MSLKICLIKTNLNQNSNLTFVTNIYFVNWTLREH